MHTYCTHKVIQIFTGTFTYAHKHLYTNQHAQPYLHIYIYILGSSFVDADFKLFPLFFFNFLCSFTKALGIKLRIIKFLWSKRPSCRTLFSCHVTCSSGCPPSCTTKVSPNQSPTAGIN